MYVGPHLGTELFVYSTIWYTVYDSRQIFMILVSIETLLQKNAHVAPTLEDSPLLRNSRARKTFKAFRRSQSLTRSASLRGGGGKTKEISMNIGVKIGKFKNTKNPKTNLLGGGGKKKKKSL
mgnify:CR=1 FL=1